MKPPGRITASDINLDTALTSGADFPLNLSESEIPFRVVVGDVLHHCADALNLA